METMDRFNDVERKGPPSECFNSRIAHSSFGGIFTKANHSASRRRPLTLNIKISVLITWQSCRTKVDDDVKGFGKSSWLFRVSEPETAPNHPLSVLNILRQARHLYKVDT